MAVRKERIGVVTSAAMNKTITVSVERTLPHSLYKKPVKRTKKFKAHDERGECRVGDVVRIRETRPLSKTKCWRLAAILHRGVSASVAEPVPELSGEAEV